MEFSARAVDFFTLRICFFGKGTKDINSRFRLVEWFNCSPESPFIKVSTVNLSIHRLYYLILVPF